MNTLGYNARYRFETHLLSISDGAPHSLREGSLGKPGVGAVRESTVPDYVG
jgi:hypothetical protein